MGSRPRKITLAEAAQSGVAGLDLYCETRGNNGLLCSHHGFLALSDALERCGPTKRLDEILARCRACGGRDVEVRPRFAKHVPKGNADPWSPT